MGGTDRPERKNRWTTKEIYPHVLAVFNKNVQSPLDFLTEINLKPESQKIGGADSTYPRNPLQQYRYPQRLGVRGKLKLKFKPIEMKTKSNSIRLFLNSLIAVLMFTASFELVAQKKQSTDLKDFKVLVEKTGNGI